MTTTLPIDPVLPDVIDALRTEGRVILQAPPGAGKTTRVPLALLEAGIVEGKIIMLEPRRLAARGAAQRMAQTLGEEAGQTVGFRMRGATKVSKSTRIEVVTEGILTRMLQSDPGLDGVGAVIFDEFHERSLNADLGLALTWEVRQALRDDLKLVVMSATLDAEPVAAMLENAPIVTSEGRSFPVDLQYLTRPVAKTTRLEQAMADLIVQAVKETSGGILAFLPGEGEIRRTQAALESRLPTDCTLFPLYGALPFAQQQAALKPLETGRKIVLATSIAETSLTIQDIRIVVDAGLARRARFDPVSGMSRLVTERAAKAECDQRAGRAGRVAKGVCYRLWTRGEHGSLLTHPPAEIETTDLSSLALDLAQWGSAAEDLAFLTQPPSGALSEARALLRQFGGLDDQDRITKHGRAMATLPVHPRLAHMVLIAGAQAADLAALISGRDPLRNVGIDLEKRIQALKSPKSIAGTIDRNAVAALQAEAKRLRNLAPKIAEQFSLAEQAALAYPDRIAMRRKGQEARFLMSGGKGALVPDGDGLAALPLLVALSLDGKPRDAQIRLATPIAESDLRRLYEDRIRWENLCVWSKRDAKVLARKQERFGALILKDQIWKDPEPEAVARAMIDGIKELGLSWSDAARRFAARVQMARTENNGLPDLSPDTLMATLEAWLLPHLGNVRSAAGWKEFDILPALKAMLDWSQTQMLDQIAPAKFETPLGHAIAIDYSGDEPNIALRLQEMFGVTTHPTVGAAKTPIRVTFLSPARRPIQTTTDIPGFWAGSYADLRKDMRAQYPKHPWPEDPTTMAPTTRTKRKLK